MTKKIIMRSAVCGIITAAIACFFTAKYGGAKLAATVQRQAPPVPILLVQMLTLAGGLLLLTLVNSKDLRQLHAANDRITQTRIIVKLVFAFLTGYAGAGLLLAAP
jgi:hypothetical protein